MAVLYISEYTATYADHGRGGSAAFCPTVTEQTVAIGGGSVQSAAFATRTTIIRVHTDAICSVAFGASPTATAANARFAANQTEYFAVVPGQKLAVITNT